MTTATKPRRRRGRAPIEPPPLWTDPRHTVEEPSDVAGQPRKRIQRMTDRLERRGNLTSRQAEAAKKLVDDWEIIGGAIDKPPSYMPRSKPEFEPTEAMLDASRQYRLAMQAVGARLSPLVIAVVIEDKSVEWYAEQTGQCRRRLMGKLEHALDLIGDAYGLPGG